MGVSSGTMGEESSLLGPRFDDEYVKRPCGATLPYTHTRTKSQLGYDVIAAVQRYAKLAQLVGMVAIARLMAQEVAG